MTDADVAEASELTARVFGGEERAQMRALLEAAYRDCPFLRSDLAWVAESGGRIVAKWQLLDLELRVGRATLRAAGAQALVADPAHRGLGHPRRIAHAGIAGAQELGFDLFLGFAQRGGFYRRLGTVPVLPDYAWSVDAAALPKLADDPFRPMRDGDLEHVLAHYARANERRSGSLVRGPAHWHWMPRRAPHVLVHPEGYLGYRFGEDRVDLREIGGQGDAFHAQALAKLGSLARERGLARICGEVPPDLPLVRHSQAYGAELRVRYERRSGCLALLANPERLLDELRPELEARLVAAGGADLQLHLEVLCGQRAWAGTLRAGQRRERKLRLAVDPGTLLQLTFGYAPAGALLADSHPDPADLELLDALFPAGWPYLWMTDRF